MMKLQLYMFFVLLAFSSSAFAVWVIEDIDPTSDDAGAYTSIVLDDADHPHISYFRKPFGKSGAGNCSLMHAFHDGSSWVLTAVDTQPYQSYSFGQTAIRLDSNGYPHIAYRIDYTLKYARWNGSEWYVTAAPGKSRISIALDSNDVPHISYYDYTDNSIGYAVLNGMSWDCTVLDNYSGTCEGTSIVIDSSDNPLIAYYNYGSVKYAEWNGTDWTITVVDEGAGIGYWPSLALDSSDNPRISYCDYYNGNLKYAEFDGSAWVSSTVESDGYCGYYSSLALDGNDEPHISSYSQSAFMLRYAYRSGSSWVSSTVEANAGHYTSIALDAMDDSHISYMQYNATSPHSLKYAHNTPLHIEEESDDPYSGFALHPVSPNPSNRDAAIMYTLPFACEVHLMVFDINGRSVGSIVSGQHAAGTYEACIESLSGGIYLIKLLADDFTDTTKMIVLD